MVLVDHVPGVVPIEVGPMKSLRPTISLSGMGRSEVGFGEVETSIGKLFS